MNSMMVSLRNENGGLRGLTGSGEPGLATLLGGTSPEQDASAYTTTGGPGQISATTRLAIAYKDVRLAGVASGAGVPTGAGPGGGDGRSGSGRRTVDASRR